MAEKLTTETFITKAKEIHNDLYSYDKVVYIDSRTKVTITCKIHGDFDQVPSSHIQKHGCLKCRGEKTHSKTLKERLSKIVQSLPNTYTYNLEGATSGLSKITATCPVHGDWTPSIFSLMNKRGCPVCGHEKRKAAKIENNKNRFADRASKIHDNKYTYDMTTYSTNSTKMQITCKIHGTFSQSPKDHLAGKGCPSCANSWGFKRSFFKDKRTLLYYIQFINGPYKIGITTRYYLSQRFNNDMKYRVIKLLEFSKGELAWDLESAILKKTKTYAYKGDLFINKQGRRNGETECRTTNIIKEITNELKKEKYEQLYKELM